MAAEGSAAHNLDSQRRHGHRLQPRRGAEAALARAARDNYQTAARLLLEQRQHGLAEDEVRGHVAGKKRVELGQRLLCGLRSCMWVGRGILEV